jgi:dienelactone hydrolase
MSCPDCFNGAIHEGTPTGTVTKLHGLDVYVAEPASGNPAKGIVGRCEIIYGIVHTSKNTILTNTIATVLIPDIFGWDFVNIRLLADHFATKRDYRVYVPDFMKGRVAFWAGSYNERPGYINSKRQSSADGDHSFQGMLRQSRLSIQCKKS